MTRASENELAATREATAAARSAALSAASELTDAADRRRLAEEGYAAAELAEVELAIFQRQHAEAPKEPSAAAQRLETARLHASILQSKTAAESERHGAESQQANSASLAHARALKKLETAEREADWAAALEAEAEREVETTAEAAAADAHARVERSLEALLEADTLLADAHEAVELATQAHAAAQTAEAAAMVAVAAAAAATAEAAAARAASAAATASTRAQAPASDDAKLQQLHEQIMRDKAAAEKAVRARKSWRLW